jgi:hypothetical protein
MNLVITKKLSALLTGMMLWRPIFLLLRLMTLGNWYPLFYGVNLIDLRWVLKVKLPADGSIERYKVLLVAKRCKQRYDLDNDETFSHVIKPATIGYCFLRVFLTDGIFISLTFKMHFL